MLIEPRKTLVPIGTYSSRRGSSKSRCWVVKWRHCTRLNVTTKTEYQRRQIDKTTGAKGAVLLVRYLIREGLLEP